MRLRFVAVCLFVVVAAGCGGPTLAPAPNLYWATGEHPYDELPEALRTTAVEIIYATDRKPEGEKGGKVEYGYQRSHSLAVGAATIQMGDGLTWEQLVEASTQREHPHKVPLSLTGVKELVRLPPSNTPLELADGEPRERPAYVAARDEAAAAIQAVIRKRLALSPVKEVFLYVHGYNNSFEYAAFRMATLWHYMGRPGVAILYSWPAGHPGPLKGYTYDRESSEFTVYHLKQLSRILAACPEVQKINVIGHSRGTDVVLSALRELWIESRAAMVAAGATPPKLGNVAIAAADIDWDVLQQRFGAERVLMGINSLAFYLSEEDKAIGISGWLFDSLARMGRLGVSLLSPEQRDALARTDDLQVIDAKVKAGFIGHAYFIDDPAVLSDVILFLRDGRRPGAEHGRPLSRRPGEFWTITDDYLVKPPAAVTAAPAAPSAVRPVGPG